MKVPLDAKDSVEAPPGSRSFWHETFGFAITLLLTTLIFALSFWRVLSSGDPRLMAGLGDAHSLNGPKAFFLDARLQQGEFPLWVEGGIVTQVQRYVKGDASARKILLKMFDSFFDGTVGRS